MRLPRFRFTIRRMMVAVAIAGLYCSYVVILSRTGVLEYGSKIWLTGEENEPACSKTGASLHRATPPPGSESRVAYAVRIASWLTLPPAVASLLGLASIAALIRPSDSDLTPETHEVLRYHRGVAEQRGRTERE